MTGVPVRLALFAVAAAVALLLGYGVGALAGPFGDEGPAPQVHESHE